MILDHFFTSIKSFVTSQYCNIGSNNIILTFTDEDSTIKAYNQLLFFAPNIELLYFPTLDTLPYDRTSPNPNIIAERAKVFSTLATTVNRKLVVTNAINLITKLPPPDIFAAASLKLTLGQKITAKQLSHFLIENGFSRSVCATDSGEFAVRGEIIDIVLSATNAYRISFGWDQIESIKKFDIDSQISTAVQEELILSPASEIILNPITINNFKNNYLTNFGINRTATPLCEAIIAGRKFPGYEHLLPLYYKKLAALSDYLNNFVIIYDNLSLPAILEYENSYQDFYQARLQSNKINSASFYPALPPSQLCLSSSYIKEILARHGLTIDSPAIKEISHSISPIPAASEVQDQELSSRFRLIDSVMKAQRAKTIFCCSSKSSIERLKNIAGQYSYKYVEIAKLTEAKDGVVNFTMTPLANGFATKQYLFIADHELLGEKSTSNQTQSSKRRLKNILTELDSFQEGELIVHQDHGIGKFIAVEIIEVGGKPHDCLKILYAGNDRLYIPVENIGVVKKYGNFEAELDKLGSVSWQKRKAKLKNRISEIAGQLLQVAAKRKLINIAPIEFEEEAYDKFCARFNYPETEDQLRAINDVKSDLTLGILMDRLICGDVGFGKTEVAMRAAYMIATSHCTPAPQVAIIAPTTILSKQHYMRFLERFSGLGLNILQLSRLVKPSEAKTVKEQIKNGSANIIIGTHALLAEDITFNNLKLLIIDEEQHFGVVQKERLKKLKSNVHILALSATPIPRTLQMSMVGLKDLSLIATPPVDRLAIRTTIMPFDRVIIRDALLREHFRGGRSFYVCPRIKDIHDIEKKLQEMVPELKYRIAHGQMPPAIVDEIMNDFCNGKFDILLSTTIIESGIDIAEANTIIIHKADRLGLSQLYQLRGRIGRSKVRGYAYLTLAGSQAATTHAIKRLEVMQTVDSLGAGFAIASHDMDLRGFGNLVGEEQSGQIKEVGVELYQEMLDEQIANLKDEPLENADNIFMPTINLGLPIFIPDNYIEDSSLRLAIYKRIGDLQTIDEIEGFQDEMVDRFGSIPAEFDNLLNIVKIKQICIKLNIENLDSGLGGFVLTFHKDADVSAMVAKFVSKYPHATKIKPNSKLVFAETINHHNVITETHKLLESLSEAGK